jgi:hypothetical protein
MQRSAPEGKGDHRRSSVKAGAPQPVDGGDSGEAPAEHEKLASSLGLGDEEVAHELGRHRRRPLSAR